MNMNWDDLLCADRIYWPLDLEEDERPNSDPLIDVFQNDSSRITNSSAYHRLQRKTQVLPFPKTDYPRSRLTHTNEVSDCGREVARMIGHKLEDMGEFDHHRTSAIEDIVSAACKGHDIGNPPFGHAGEFAIQSWVLKNAGPLDCKKYYITNDKLMELGQFDGNGQGFRLLTVTSGWRRKGGLQLSAAVLAAFCKYPWAAKNGITGKKKYSVPIGSEEIAEHVFKKVGLIQVNDIKLGSVYCRHPLAYIVEAADDISYITSDLEDAARADVGNIDKILGFLERIAKDAIEDPVDRANFRKRQEKIAGNDKKALMRYLKDHAQRALKIVATDSFISHYPKIMSGNMGEALLESSRIAAVVREAKDYMRSDIYDDVGKIKHEVFGLRVITELLSFYFDILFSVKAELDSGKNICSGVGGIDEVLRRGIITFPIDNYTGSSDWEVAGNYIKKSSKDELAQMVVDYVSGMTDQYAVSVFHQISGVIRPDATW